MNIKNWFQFLWLRVGPDEPLDLKSWRKWLVNVILFFTALTMPLVMLVTFPVFIAEKHYGLIAFDVIIWFLVIIGIFKKAAKYQIRAYCLLAFLYTMTIIFFVALGPHHARSGWLVMCSVMAALMFGVHAATVSATINAAVLMMLYWLMGPENQVWAAEYTAPFSKWVMFVVNIFLITLAASLPVGFLLNRLNRSFNSERDAHGKLSVESEKLQTSYIVLQDEIEEHKQSKEALKESYRYTRGLIEVILDPLVAIAHDGKITDVNSAAVEITGATREEMIGSDSSDYFTEPEKARAGYKQVFEEGFARNYSLEIRHKNGKTTPVLFNASVYKDEQGNVIGVLAAARDVTELKRAEEEINKLSIAVAQSIDGIALADLETKLTYVNEAFAGMHGYSPEEMIGMKIANLHKEEDLDIINNIHNNHFKREGAWIGELVHIKKDGTTFPTITSSTLLKDAKEKPTGILGVIRDVTEQKRLEKQLQQAQRIEAIGTLAGGIAHDFNNILSAITGYSEIALYHELPEGNPARYSIEQVLKASGRATALVQQILAFSRQKEQELIYVKVIPIVKEAIKLLRASLPTTVEIRRNITADPDTVMGDPSQIHQVLMNLCTNAGHAMREKGGVLEVSLTNVHFGLRPGEIENAFHRAGTADLEDDEKQSAIDLAPGKYLKLSVSDTGQGMTPDILAHIFDPYFTTKAVGEGTGLGLSVVYGIIKSLGGKIDVKSVPGKGTTFNVFLPSIGAEDETETEIREPVPTGKEHILFIDDEEVLVDIGKRMLEGLGYKVTIRTSSIEALEAFRAQPEKFDLVITDMTMPNLTGDKLAGELMSIRPDIPIILCTGFSELITEEKAKSMGIRGFIMKPFVIREIAETIREGLEE